MDGQAKGSSFPEVGTRNGKVRGVAKDGVASFKGIPYAAPIEGLNRWLPPQPPAPFSDTFDASRFGPSAPQSVPNAPEWAMPKAGRVMMKMNEGMTDPGPDCLSLNVWAPVPEQRGEDKLPVMVFIHGGGLSTGGSSLATMDGTHLAQRGNLVVVSLNYRLGGIGFLAADGLFEGDVGVGNRGFMDIVAALEWVQANIEQFGGDPDRVTVVGQSAGGTCVWALLSSPTTEGLFHRAVVMSGPIVMIDLADQHKFSRDVLKAMKVPVGDVEALAEAPNDVVVGAKMQTMLYRRGEPYGEMSRIRLPAAGAYDTEFMPVDVFEAMANARLRNIDLLVGNCDNDGRVAVLAMPGPKSVAIRMGNSMFKGLYGDTKAERDALFASYKAAMPDADNYTVQERVQSDGLYRMRSMRAAEIHSRNSSGKTYMYQYQYQARGLDGAFGAFHGFDMSFMFNNLETLGEALGDDEGVAEAQGVADTITDAWAAFVHTGTPAAADLPEWPQFDPDTRQTMNLDVESAVVADPDSEIRQIWSNTAAET